MKAHEMVNQQTLESRIFALAARLHVILRREKGRVTDIEYMRLDPAYCRHVLGLVDSAQPEPVYTLCSTLEELYFGERGLFARRAPALPVPIPAAVTPLSPPPLKAVAGTGRYIGRLR
jgi:hypothetical protein